MGWPYQVVGVDLVTFAERFPNLAPPKASAAGVNRGFLIFRQECATCHTINGEGGNKAPELNYPTSVTEYFKEAWLRKWITEPTSLRYNTTMPALNKNDPHWKRHLDDVVAYLKAMAGNKKKPSK
jgi:mono/diheme cytochrome c family protein